MSPEQLETLIDCVGIPIMCGAVGFAIGWLVGEIVSH